MNLKIFNRMINALPKIQDITEGVNSLNNLHYEISNLFFQRCTNSDNKIINFIGYLNQDEHFFQLSQRVGFRLIKANTKSFKFSIIIAANAIDFYSQQGSYQDRLILRGAVDSQILHCAQGFPTLKYNPSKYLYGNLEFNDEQSYRLSVTAHLGNEYSTNSIRQLVNIIGNFILKVEENLN